MYISGLTWRIAFLLPGGFAMSCHLPSSISFRFAVGSDNHNLRASFHCRMFSPYLPSLLAMSLSVELCINSNNCAPIATSFPGFIGCYQLVQYIKVFRSGRLPAPPLPALLTHRFGSSLYCACLLTSFYLYPSNKFLYLSELVSTLLLSAIA